jgi:hypothetical protein
VKRLLLVVGLVWVSVAGLSGSPEGQRIWFRFNKAFITAHYADGEAFGTVKAQTWGAAKTVHSTKCGGDDGELHIGALDGGIDLPGSQTPISGKASADDNDWGIVFELPDAKAGKGPGTLTKQVGKRVTFARARAQGRELGRPERHIDLSLLATARDLPVREAARRLGIPRTTLQRALARIPSEAPL